jgi:glycosidase
MPQAWRHGAVLYHIYPRSFRDSNGDGIGNLRASPRSWTMSPASGSMAFGSRPSSPPRRSISAMTLGLPEADIAFSQRKDPYGRAYWPVFKGRDGSRTPMPWERGAPQAGFSDSNRPWLPVSDAHLPLAVDQQDRDPDSVLTIWRALMRMRRDRAALRLGSLHGLDAKAPLLAFERRHERDRLLCLFNLGDVVGRFPMSQRRSARSRSWWGGVASCLMPRRLLCHRMAISSPLFRA